MWPAPFSTVWHWAHLVLKIFSPDLTTPGGAWSKDAIGRLFVSRESERQKRMRRFVWENSGGTEKKEREGYWESLYREGWELGRWENGTRSPRCSKASPNLFRWRGPFVALQYQFLLVSGVSVRLRSSTSMVGLACDLWMRIHFVVHMWGLGKSAW